MPLNPSKSKEAFKENVKTEVEAGKPQKQAVAIAYSEQGESKKKVKKSDEPNLMYGAQVRPYTGDINDLIELDEIEKGRGPDKQQRKARGSPNIDHEMVNGYVSKYKVKHPEGMGHSEAHAWMTGSGMHPHEVDHAMTQIKTRKSKEE